MRTREILWRLATAIAFALVIALVAGCASRRLRADLDEIETWRQLVGTVRAPDAGSAPILVVLATEVGGRTELTTYDVTHAGGRFHLFARAGVQQVTAFADLDRDFVLDADEPVGTCAVPRATPAGLERIVDLGAIDVAAGVDRPEIVVDLSGIGADAAAARGRRIGVEVTLDDARFDREAIQRGVWEPLGFARDTGLALYLLEPWDPERIPVLFVHGMVGSPRDFAALVEGLDRTRFQPLVYYYPTGFTLDLNGLYLAKLIGELRVRFGFERLALVAHSMGGLVTRAALGHAAREGIDLGVETFVTLSTPWLGAEGARGMAIGLEVAPTVAPSWTDMLPQSGFLEQVWQAPMPAGVRFSMLFGYAGGSRVVAGSDDGSVSLVSMLPWSVVSEAEYLLGFPDDHEGILVDPEVVAVVGRLLAGEPPTPGAARRSAAE